MRATEAAHPPRSVTFNTHQDPVVVQLYDPPPGLHMIEPVATRADLDELRKMMAELYPVPQSLRHPLDNRQAKK